MPHRRSRRRAAVERACRKAEGGQVNTDLEPGLQERFGIRGIPTLVLMDGGKELDRITGAMGADALRKWVEPRLPVAPKSP